ncbi:MAG: hypothetical protein R2838_14610 [Caldilineaceae bacterium]
MTRCALLTSTTADRLGPAQAVRGVGFQVAAAGMGIAFVPAFAGVLAERIHIEALGPFLIVLCLVLAAAGIDQRAGPPAHAGRRQRGVGHRYRRDTLVQREPSRRQR